MNITSGLQSNLSLTNKTEIDEYDYDYDVDDSMKTFFWPELLPTLVVYSITMLIGIVGNSLIIFTITVYRRMKSTTNLFLASLASADLLLIIVCIPVKVAKLFSYTWTMGVFLCKLVHYMQGVSAICSVLTLTAMSLERYYAIVHPMKAKYVCTMSQARKIIVAIWVASFFLAVPILFVQIQMVVGERVKAYWCVRDWDRKDMWRLHELYMFILILVFPATVMAITYTAICWEICRVIKRRSYMTSGKGLRVKSRMNQPKMSGRETEEWHLEDCCNRSSYRRQDYALVPQTRKQGYTTENGRTLPSECHPLSNKKTGFKSKMRLEEDSQTVRQVIKMLVAVVVVFVVCWAPLLTDNLLTAWEMLPHLRTDTLKYMATAFHLMAYFNSCVNPIVYGFMSKSFRDSFSKALCCKTRTPRRQLSVSHTRTTSLRTADTKVYIN